MKKRIAIVGLYHESNTFSSLPTKWENFNEGHIFFGEEIIEKYHNAHHEIGGFLEGIKDSAIEIIPLYFADVIPSGTIDKGAFNLLLDSLLDSLRSVLPVDAVYCSAHGAAVSEDVRDVDGYWMTRLRELVGEQIPVVGTLDPHANVSLSMVRATNALIAYTTNPHLDQRATGLKAAKLMRRLLCDDLTVKHELIQLPAVISIEQQETDVEPCLSMYKRIGELMKQKEVVSYSIVLGFPYADVEDMGTSFILVSELGFDTTVLKDKVRQVFAEYYPMFTGDRLYIEDVLAKEKDVEPPVLLLDMGDNVGGGALGSSPYLLNAIESFGLGNSCIVLYNPLLVEKLVKHHIGDHVQIEINDLESAGINSRTYRVEVLEIKDGKFWEKAPRHGGQMSYDMGEVALVKTQLGNYIILTSLRVPPFSSQQIQIFDLDITKLDWIIAKGVNAPIAAYKAICSTYYKVHTPGVCNADPTQFEYLYRRKPMLPFEPVFELNRD